MDSTMDLEVLEASTSGSRLVNSRELNMQRPRKRRNSSALNPDLRPIQDGPPAELTDKDTRNPSRGKELIPEGGESATVGSNDRLLPPQYGRPARPSSPDVLNALFHPVLRSLSRPSSPANKHHAQTDASSRLVSLSSSEQQQRATSSLPSHFPPRNPTDPAPTVESQGFLLYISSLLLYILYLGWSFFPDAILEEMGISWYPSREWALLIPSWITMTVLYVYLAYIFLNMSNTVTPEESLASLDNPKAFVSPPRPTLALLESLGLPSLEKNGKPVAISRLYLDSISASDDTIPPLYDLPLAVVNRVLYDSN